MKKEDKMLLALGYCAIPQVRQLILSLEPEELQEYVPKLLEFITERSKPLYHRDTSIRKYSVRGMSSSTDYIVTTLSYFLANELDPNEWKIGANDEFSVPEALLALLPFRLTRPFSEPKMSMDWWKQANSIWGDTKFYRFRRNLYTAFRISKRSQTAEIYVNTPDLREYLLNNWSTELAKGSFKDLLTFVRGCSMTIGEDIYIVLEDPTRSRKISVNYKFIDMFK